jgi:redox-sensitive bicupin YhaK (pirin superfamily)
MITKRYKDNRGPTNTGWLRSMHSFSFGHYMDPEHMGFGPLRVINEDRVVPGAGFSTHSHSNMEIISYVLDGELAHKDSMGTGSVIKAGDVQLMSAGSGVSHSEFNNSSEKGVHFLQMWVMPNEKNAMPTYQQKAFAVDGDNNKFVLAISPDGQDGSLIIRQDARMYVGKFDENFSYEFPLNSDRHYWVQVAEGIVEVNDDVARAGDGYAISAEDVLRMKSSTQTKVILFELP